MNELIIDKKDLKNNIKIIKNIAEKNDLDENGNKTKIIAVVKGNGYGLGIVEFTKYLIENGINFFAVSTVDEAIKLRKNGIDKEILMLSSTAIKKELETLVENNIIVSIGSKEAGDMLEQIAIKKNIKPKVHIKIDTGFGRYGFIYNNRDEIIESIKNWNNLQVQGAFSHFSLSFYKKSDYTKKQFNRFIDCIEVLKMNDIDIKMIHICNSSAFIKFPRMHLNAVRIGSAFLGRLSFFSGLDLKKIGYFKSNVSEIKTLPKGFYVGYSNSYKTKQDTNIAIIPCGYSSGINVKPQRDMFRKRDKIRYIIDDLKNFFRKQGLYVEINNQKCKIIGRIGMNNIIVDITNKDVQIGNEVKFDVNPICINSDIKRNYK